jgi:hypothetical protein
MTAAEPLELLGVAHLVRPTRLRACNLEELRHAIGVATDATLFHHTVQYALRHRRVSELPPDDLSAWVWGVVHDPETAERLWFAIRTRNQTPELLRRSLLEVLDRIPEARRVQRDAPEKGEFTLLESDWVLIPTGVVVENADDVAARLCELDLSVWFYHLVQEPWFSGGRSRLLEWLHARGATRLETWLREAVTSGLPLATSRSRFGRRVRQSQLVRRVRQAASETEDERRLTGRVAVQRLIRRQGTGPGAS